MRPPMEPGQLVLHQNVALELQWSRKFEDRWLGPYRVVQRLPKGSYLLEELDGTRLKKAFAARRLRRFYPRGVPTTASDDSDAAEEEDMEDVEQEKVDAVDENAAAAEWDKWSKSATDTASSTSRESISLPSTTNDAPAPQIHPRVPDHEVLDFIDIPIPAPVQADAPAAKVRARRSARLHKA